jgi:hypothetical protein
MLEVFPLVREDRDSSSDTDGERQIVIGGASATVTQHLSCIRMLFDWLVTGQVLPFLIRGATTVMSSQAGLQPLDLLRFLA